MIVRLKLSFLSSILKTWFDLNALFVIMTGVSYLVCSGLIISQVKLLVFLRAGSGFFRTFRFDSTMISSNGAPTRAEKIFFL